MVLDSDSNVALSDSSVVNLQEPLVVVGIPAYNEEKTIARVILGAQKHSHIVVVCDDGSTDLTAEIAEGLSLDEFKNNKLRIKGFSLI